MADGQDVCAAQAADVGLKTASSSSVNDVGRAVELTSQFTPLSYLHVELSDNEGNRCVDNVLSDSGAKVALANTSAIADFSPIDIGSVRIKGVIGNPISLPLMRLNVAAADRPERVVSFACAVTDQANTASILTADVVRKLMPQVEKQFKCNAVYGENDDDDDDDENNDAIHNVDVYDNYDNGDDTGKNNGNIDDENENVTLACDEFYVNQKSIPHNQGPSCNTVRLESPTTPCPVGAITDVPGNHEAVTLRFEQLSDKSLSGCFSLAKRNKGRLTPRHPKPLKFA